MFDFFKNFGKKANGTSVEDSDVMNEIDDESNLDDTSGLTEAEIYELGLEQNKQDELAQEAAMQKNANKKKKPEDKKIRIEKNPNMQEESSKVESSRIKPLPNKNESYDEVKAKYEAEIAKSKTEKELGLLRQKVEASKRDTQYVGGLRGYSDFELQKEFQKEYRKAYRYVMANKEAVGDRAELRSMVVESEKFGVDEGLLQQLTAFRKRVEGKTVGAVAGKAIKGTAKMVKAMPRVGASGVRAVGGVGRELSNRGNAQARSFGGSSQGRIMTTDPTKILDASQAMNIYATPRVRVGGNGGMVSRMMTNPVMNQTSNPMSNPRMNLPQNETYLRSIGRGHTSPVSQITDRSWLKKIINL